MNEFQRFFAAHARVPDRSISENLGSQVNSISARDIETPSNMAPVKTETVKQVSSYNWMETDTDKPTIMVPGGPGEWIAPRLPVTIPQDTGSRFVDQNAARSPMYPLEPLFRSVYQMKPAFDPKTIDLVTDRNNLRKLIFAVSHVPIEQFRIDIELVGNTMLFTRWEKSSKENIQGFHGFGHEFEKKFTKFPKSLEKSTGHHRIIEYQLGSITVLLRFEVDGYQQTASPSTPASTSIDDLTTKMQATRLDSKTKKVAPSTFTTGLTVINDGFDVPHESVLELKTRAAHKPLKIGEAVYQLWFAQVQLLKVGYHVRSKGFTTLHEVNFKTNGTFAKFEEEKGHDLKKLIVLLEKIRDVVKNVEGRRAILLYIPWPAEEFVIHSSTGVKHALPTDLLEKWNK